MNQNDIEFTVGLDTSPAEQKLNQFQSKMSMADAAFERMQSAQNNQNRAREYFAGNPARNNFPSNQNSVNIGRFENVDPSHFGMMKTSFYSAGAYEQLAKISMQQEKTALRRAIRQVQSEGRGDDALSASEKLSRLENASKLEKQSNIIQGEITDETKAQNREHNESYIKLSKLHKLLLAILGVWKAMQQIAKNVIHRASEVNENLGYFSIDREGAFYANVDKSRAMVYAGMRNMGAANPLTKSDYDAVTTRMQEQRTNALTGKGLDKDYATAMQVLNQKWGLGLSAAQLYTKGDVNLTEIENRDLKKIEEEILPALAKLPSLQRDQFTNYLQTIYGANTINALMANRNLRDAGSASGALIDRLLLHGENEVSNVNVSKYSSELADSFAELKESWKELGDILLMDFFPAIKAVTGGLKAFVDWLHSKFNWKSEDVSYDAIEGESYLWGGANMLDKSSSFYDRAHFGESIFGKTPDDKETIEYFKKKNAKAEAAEIMRNARRTGYLSFNDAFKAVAYSSTDVTGGKLIRGMESGNIDNQLRAVYQMYLDRTLSDSKYNKIYSNILQGKLGVMAYNTLGNYGARLSYEDFISRFDEQVLTNLLSEYYGEGGILDLSKSDLEDPAEGLFKGLSTSQRAAAISRLGPTFNLDSTGGKFIIKTEDVKGGLDVNIILSDTKGTVSTERINVPVSSQQTSMDNLKAILRDHPSYYGGNR